MIKKHIPNSITCCNLVSGCIATVYALAGNAETALLWIIIGAVFDFYDGMAARLLHVSSPIGKELDSLADDITFGMAPSAIIFSQLQMMSYPTFLEPLRFYLPFAAFIMAAFSTGGKAFPGKRTLPCRRQPDFCRNTGRGRKFRQNFTKDRRLPQGREHTQRCRLRRETLRAVR